jgi:hypothetical protein
MRTTVILGMTAALLAAVVGGGVAPASAATLPGYGYGSITVQLTSPDGTPLRLGGVEVAEIGPTGAGDDALTRPDGTVTLGQVYGPVTVTLTTESIPIDGASTVAPGQRTGVRVLPGAVTSVTLPLAVGATVAGSIVGPSGVTAGKTVLALDETDPSRVFQTTSDAAGRYEFDGLGTGIYTIEASATQVSTPGQWKTSVVQQVGSTPASHVALAQHYVHSDYDLAIDAAAPGRVPSPALSGATVTATSATGAWSTRFSTVLDTLQTAQFEVPTGTYRLSLVTTATAEAPSRTLWFSTAHTWSPDPAAALPVAVSFGSWSGWSGTTAD